MYNKMIVTGRLGEEIKIEKKGKWVIGTGTICTTSKRKDKKTHKMGVTWVKYQAWGTVANNIAEYCRKGSVLTLEGHYIHEPYKGSDGKMYHNHFLEVEEMILPDVTKDYRQEGNLFGEETAETPDESIINVPDDEPEEFLPFG